MSRRRKPGPSHNLVGYSLGGKSRPPILKEEFWQDEAGTVIRYSLAYIDPETFAGDNGRVLGYDNADGYHHRHFMGCEYVQIRKLRGSVEPFRARSGRVEEKRWNVEYP